MRKGLRFIYALYLTLALIAKVQAQTAEVPTQFIRDLEGGKSRTLVAFGTSLTAGGAWVGLLDAYLKTKYPGMVQVFNEGGSGHSSVWGLKNVANVTRHNPDLVLIEFAMNDAYYPPQNGYTEGVTVDSSRANLRHIIDSIQARNPKCEIILQTMDLCLGPHRQRRPLLEAYYQGYREEASAGKFLLADHMLNWKSILDWDTTFYLSWLPDSIHPNAEASAAITLPGAISALLGAKTAIDNTLPASISEGVDIEIRAGATSPATRVDFFQGKTKIGTDSTFPYAYTWKNPPVGSYLITSKLMQGYTVVAVSQGRALKVLKPSSTRRYALNRLKKPDRYRNLRAILLGRARGSAGSVPNVDRLLPWLGGREESASEIRSE